MKNLTPNQISLVTAFLVSLLLFVIIFIFELTAGSEINYMLLLGIPFLVFVASYILFLAALQIFIYRKIKVIYKTIHDLKSINKKNTLVPLKKLNDNLIQEVEHDVMEWAEDKEKEITELKNMEQYRREFIGNVSHELKTPIFNIQGYLHTLIDGGIYDESINVEYLNRAAKNLERLNTIVEDLEAISLLESGELVIETQKFDIHQLTKDVFESLEMQAETFDISLGFKKGCDKPTFVVADKERIRQVLTNLIYNSIKYGKDGGKTRVGFYDMDKNILIEIADDGLGIEKEHLPRIFERFYRIDKSRSREKGGTGLGLAIVKHIIEAHNQTITVRSTKDVGSTFGFTLRKSR